MDEILNFISMYWVAYLEHLEKGGLPKKHTKILERIQQHFPVNSIKYTDNPSKIEIDQDLTTFSYASDNPDAEIFFPEEVNGHYKLYAVHYKGCITTLYGVADEHQRPSND